LIDDVSNAVCTVIDAVELCRSVHASPDWRRAALDAFGVLSEYIGSLNADASIYLCLRQFIFEDDDDDGRGGGSSSSSVLSRLPLECRRMTHAMRREFKRDGIHLTYDKREEARELNNVIVGLEGLFASNITEKVKYFDVVGRDMVSQVDAVVPRHVLGQLVRRSTPPPAVEDDRLTLSGCWESRDGCDGPIMVAAKGENRGGCILFFRVS
jgi:Zn-dependent oligopeptidase